MIHGFGGVTISDDQTEMRDGEAIAVSLAGPAAEVALGFGALALCSAPASVTAIASRPSS